VSLRKSNNQQGSCSADRAGAANAVVRALSQISSSPWVHSLRKSLNWLLELGTAGYPPDVRHRLKIMNAIAFMIAVSTAGYAYQQSFWDYEKFKPVIWLNVSLGILAILVPLSHRISDIAGGLIIVVAEYIALCLFTRYFGHASGVHLQYFVAAAAPFVVFGLERIRLILVTVTIGIALQVYAWFAFPPSAALIVAGEDILNPIYTQAAVTTGVLIAATVWYAFSLAAHAKAETDRLLRNVLPESVVDRLKANPEDAIADSHAEASVLFADISGFVALSRQLGPARVVDLLNDIVRRFDELAERHGVEKIKTIGDAYMAVAGVPEPAADHAARLGRMAFGMLDAIALVRRETGLDLHVRVGMASGPVMAGVIGTRKFSYDVWGDTVNLASRLEGASERGRILICPDCHEKLAGVFEFEPRGTIEIKGVGPQATWFLAAPLSQPMSGAL